MASSINLDLFTQPSDAIGAFSKEQYYGPYTCYRHLQGDMCYVAERRSTGERTFFRDVTALCTWVESQRGVAGQYYTWK